MINDYEHEAQKDEIYLYEKEYELWQWWEQYLWQEQQGAAKIIIETNVENNEFQGAYKEGLFFE